MCLVVVKGTNKRKAKADILVYKCLDCYYGNYCTPYYYFPVYFEEGKCVLKVKNFTYDNFSDDKRVEAGIHSFYSEFAAQDIVNDFHETDGTEKHYAIIPKGTNYYIGNGCDVVSTELIVFEKENDYKEYVKNSEKICIIDDILLSLEEI